MPREIKVGADAVQEADDGYSVQLPDSVVTEEDLRKNFVPKDDHESLKSSVEERVNTAVRNAREKARDELLGDDEFLERAIKERDEFFGARFPESDVDPEKIRDQFREEELQPVKEQAETLQSENERLKQRAVQGERDRAMSQVRVDPDHRELIDDHLARRTKWSDKHGRTVVLDDDGEVRTKVSDGEMRPVTVEEYLASMKASGKYDYAFASEQRGGGDFRGGDRVTPDNIDDLIEQAERAGNFARAGELKARKLEGMSGGSAGG